MTDPKVRKLVLVVDDEPDLRLFLSAVLEDNGFDVETASNGRAALEFLEHTVPDLITLDVAMPEKSGVGVYRAIREGEATRDLPVIMVTGVSEDFRRFISTRKKVPPPNAYLAKPIEEDQLLAAVRKVLGE